MNNIPVDVICIFDKTGKVTPLKIRIENNDGSIITTKIDEVVYHRENIYTSFATIDYHCKVVIDEVEQIIGLRYNVHECIWRIIKL